MPKKQGDLKQNKPVSMSELVDDFAAGVKARDKRLVNFWNYQPIPKMMNPDPHFGFYSSPSKVKVACGGNRSTKTWSSVYEDVMVYTGIIPPPMQGFYAHEKELIDLVSGVGRRERHVRIIVMNYRKYVDTIKPILLGSDGLLPEEWSHWNEETKMFIGPDGSFLEIESVDPRERDEQKSALNIRGAYIDHTHIDELSIKSAYTESTVRAAANKGGPKTVTLSFCPQQGFDWTYKELYKARFEYKPDRDIRKTPEESHPDIQVVIVSMKDNPSIFTEEYERQKRLHKPWEVAFRVDGRYSNRTSNAYFDADTLITWENEGRFSPGTPYRIDPVKVDTEMGIFDGKLVDLDEADCMEFGEFDSRKFPVWRIWHLPKTGHKYILTGDISAGNPDSDPHSLTVWDCTEQDFPFEAAKLHMTEIKPGPIAVQGCLMATIYGNCLLCPEANNTFGGIFAEKARNYINIYQRVKFDDNIEEKDTTKIGWFTNAFNKGGLLDNAYSMLNKMANTKRVDNHDGLQVIRNFCPFNSRDTIREFMSYEEQIRVNDNGVRKTDWGAKSGEHDDTVMEACIAFKIINHQYEEISACKVKKKNVKINENLNRIRRMSEKTSTNRPFSRMPKQEGLRQRFGRNV